MQQAAASGDILVVDDSPNNLRVLAAMLEQEGYQVRKVLTGSLALKAAQAAPPDLILLDICMADMDGYEVCQRLKANDRVSQIPVIFLSALNEIGDKIRAFQVGGADYITKPFQVEEVLARVQNHLLVRQLQQQLEHQTQTLETKIRAQTRKLQQALEYEALLKRITDRVRASLDETQILQAAVQELAHGLGLLCCDTVEYDLAAGTVKIRYEWKQDGIVTAVGQTLAIAELPDIHAQLFAEKMVQFCVLASRSPLPRHIERQYAILSSPLLNEQGTFGAIWLFRHHDESFTELECYLVRQVAEQCAIAVRQARLYQSTQAQLQEVERLNQLKDDFLSTISHELRTPISNIKLATQMLTLLLKEQGLITSGHPLQSTPDATLPPAEQYLQILQDECDKEITLVTALLDLLRLDSETEPLAHTTIHPSDWLIHLTEPFATRTETRQQTLAIAIAADLPPLTTDLDYLERIITELLTNACKYTPANGQIQVNTHLESTSLLIQVINTGIEIPPQEQALIFEKFYRIPNPDPWKYAGTGLGLALVKKLAERIGATVSVSSGDNQTCFTVQVPLEPTKIPLPQMR